MDVVRSHNRERERGNSSPDRTKICRLNQKVKPSRKVQVVYYLSRNGLLEHPHFLELTLFPNQPLRLKDVFDRLMALRGSGMPLQYSWSSKRNYKSGYVWHDLALKDIIHPAEGGEYVLKGSELVEGCSERFEQVNLSKKHQPYNYNAKALFMNGKQQKEKEGEHEEYEEDQKEYEDGERTSYTSSTTTPHSRCSRGVSTEELLADQEDHAHNDQNNATKLVATNNLPRGHAPVDSNTTTPSRYSVLLQLISCGSSGAEFKPRLSNVGTRNNKQIMQCSEEKEYFSGSLVDSIKANRVSQPLLKRSNSYNEERKSKLGMEEVTEEENKVGVKEKCIPIKKSPKESSKS